VAVPCLFFFSLFFPSFFLSTLFRYTSFRHVDRGIRPSPSHRMSFWNTIRTWPNATRSGFPLVFLVVSFPPPHHPFYPPPPPPFSNLSLPPESDRVYRLFPEAVVVFAFQPSPPSLSILILMFLLPLPDFSLVFTIPPSFLPKIISPSRLLSCSIRRCPYYLFSFVPS